MCADAIALAMKDRTTLHGDRQNVSKTLRVGESGTARCIQQSSTRYHAPSRFLEKFA